MYGRVCKYCSRRYRRENGVTDTTRSELSKEISNGNINEDLISEIERLKEHYKPFLMDLTPKVETLKTRHT